MKKLYPLAAVASLAFAAAITLGFTPARSGDLGGSCCADLEERVAELEATTAKKGNRKVTVEVYGQVSKSLLWIDAGSVKDGVVVDNANSPTRFGFTGTAKINPNTTAGYRIEIGAGDELSIRQSHLWIEGVAGRVTLGRASTATDGISEISLANTNVANLPSNLYGIIVDGARKDVLRYDTPVFGGFTAGASWTTGNEYDLSLRYSGEGAGIRFAAGIGYADEIIGKRISGSASAMHLQSGLFLGLTAGQFKVEGFDPVRAYHVTAGIETKAFTSLGATTLFGEYGRLTYVDLVGDGWGLGAVQAIDAAAMDIFASYRSIEDINVMMVGSRIKF